MAVCVAAVEVEADADDAAAAAEAVAAGAEAQAAADAEAAAFSALVRRLSRGAPETEAMSAEAKRARTAKRAIDIEE